MVLGLTVSANATLLDRGGGLIYDDDFNITWLQDANYAQTSGYDADGLMNWNDAMTWAANLVYGGYDDWRLPTALNQDGSGPCVGYNCTSSEMGHLYNAAPPDGLGNVAWFSGCTLWVDCGLVNTDPFTNLQAYLYWSGTEYAPNPELARVFFFSDGFQSYDSKGHGYYAWAVRPGDVSAPIPEPSTMLLLGSGLVGLVAWRKRLGRNQG